MNIVKYISDLLYDHECVVIPGLGGFVSSYQSASIHPVQHQFNPPSKNLMFNEALQNNDGLLANYISTKQRISYETAVEKINEFVADIKNVLANGEQFSLENIGNLYLGRDGNLQFDQNNRMNYLKDAYGMSSFVSPAIRRESVSTPKVVKPVFAQQTANTRNNQNAGFLIRIAAAVIVVLTLGVFGYGYLKNAAPEAQQTNIMTSLNDIVNHQPEVSQDLNAQKNEDVIPSAPENPVEIKDDASSVLINKEASTVAETPAEEKPEAKENPDNAEVLSPAPEVKPVKTQKMYHLIAGSFQDDSNTGLLIQKYADLGYNPSVIGPTENGYFRVSIIAYLRKDEALIELKKVRKNHNPDIWLLRQ